MACGVAVAALTTAGNSAVDVHAPLARTRGAALGRCNAGDSARRHALLREPFLCGRVCAGM